MVEAREDAFFIGDANDGGDTIAQAVTQGEAVDSNYVGTYYPWVKTIDRNTNKLTAVPPSVLMPGIYAANDAFAEWFAPARFKQRWYRRCSICIKQINTR